MIAIQLQDDAWTDVEEGTEALLDEWLVKPGDSVAAGQVLANVMVVKTAFEVVSPAAGKITKLLVDAQGNFARGQPLAELQPA
jgi:pyruvate/2-oxoglutarate dehydrogenase complex dihydrolipoamide acyltransferase (E2) component